jgi:integrase
MAGLKPITLHEIRHTVATLLKEAGVPMKEIQTILGHSSIMTTMYEETPRGVHRSRRTLFRI